MSVFFLLEFRELLGLSVQRLFVLEWRVVCLLLFLSGTNWVIECWRWHLFLKFQGIQQHFIQATRQVFLALPYAMVLGKIAGTSAGRLLHFKRGEIIRAGKAQFFSSVYQSLALMSYLLFSLFLVFEMRAMAFALCLVLFLFALLMKGRNVLLFCLGIIEPCLFWRPSW